MHSVTEYKISNRPRLSLTNLISYYYCNLLHYAPFAGDHLDMDATSEMDVSAVATSSSHVTSEMEDRPKNSTTAEISLKELSPSAPSSSSQTPERPVNPQKDQSTQASVSPDIMEQLKLQKQVCEQNATEIRILKEKLKQSEDKAKACENALFKCFTANQVQCLVSGKPISRWQDIDMVNALALKSLSIKTYNYIRSHMNIPLPDVSTVNRWVAGINMEPGKLNSVLRMMAQQSESLSSGQKACILLFDEMKVERKYCYDKGADKIYQPHNYVQVVMAQGILYNWIQPLYYDYDQKMTKDLLCDLIEATEKAGYPVHGIVCDMAGANQGLLKSLGINMSNTSFHNPINSERQIHVFADTPHVLKLVRNNLLDHGIETPFGYASSEPLREVIRYQNGDFKLTPKLSESNLTVTGSLRQKVKPAAQLLSQSMADALQYLADQGIIRAKNCEATRHVVDLVDRWFDIMNSSSKNGHKPSAAGFVASPYQLSILTQIINMFQNATVKGKTFPFQTGIVISSKSIMKLYADMKDIYSVSFLLTRRVNQDSLERTFGILRQMGSAFDHPEPKNFKYRMRQFVLSNKHVLVSVNPNTMSFKKDSFIVEGIKEFKKFSSPVKKGVTGQLKVNDDCEGDVADDMDILFEECLLDEFDHEFEEFKLPAYETDGFDYVLGYVAHKFKDKYPYLSSLEKENEWIARQDRGGLHEMDQNFKGSFTELEDIFRKRHLHTLQEECDAVLKLVKLASHIRNIPTDVISFYFRTRIYFRIRELNKGLSMEKVRVKSKKMKKIAS